jgi:integrase
VPEFLCASNRCSVARCGESDSEAYTEGSLDFFLTTVLSPFATTRQRFARAETDGRNSTRFGSGSAIEIFPTRPDAFVALVRRTDVPIVRFHDLRHTHATQLLREGVHPKIVSERLGHSTVGITLDVYSHVLPGMQEEAAMRTDAALRAALALE